MATKIGRFLYGNKYGVVYSKWEKVTIALCCITAYSLLPLMVYKGLIKPDDAGLLIVTLGLVVSVLLAIVVMYKAMGRKLRAN